MERQSFTRRAVAPALIVLAAMVAGSLIYDSARSVADPSLHGVMSHTGALLMFLSIWLGALFANTMAFFRGAGFGERLAVCLIVPLSWTAKVLSGFIGIYSTGEFFFLSLHHFVIGCPLVALLCMGISEIWCRMLMRRRRGAQSIRLFAFSNTAVLAGSFCLVFLMLWNGGHWYYYRYMDWYTRLFH